MTPGRLHSSERVLNSPLFSHAGHPQRAAPAAGRARHARRSKTERASDFVCYAFQHPLVPLLVGAAPATPRARARSTAPSPPRPASVAGAAHPQFGRALSHVTRAPLAASACARWAAATSAAYIPLGINLNPHPTIRRPRARRAASRPPSNTRVTAGSTSQFTGCCVRCAAQHHQPAVGDARGRTFVVQKMD
jgi:hypothetical protein